jgi:hypothetical protein
VELELVPVEPQVLLVQAVKELVVLVELQPQEVVEVVPMAQQQLRVLQVRWGKVEPVEVLTLLAHRLPVVEVVAVATTVVVAVVQTLILLEQMVAVVELVRVM